MFNPYFLVPRFLSLIFIFSFFLEIGCTPIPVQKTLTAAELLQAGKRELELSDDVQAKALFQQVLEDYPDSQERVAALMLLADTNYSGEEYQEAKFHYRRFIELYPANKYVDRAHYYKAMSDFRMMDIALRDQSSTKSALASFELLINNFPKSRYKQQAIKRRDECLNNLAGNIMEIGRYYFRTRSYQSAIVRLQSLAEQYPNHANMDEAVFLIAESYFNSQNFSKARRKYHKLLKEYPQSLYAKKARSRLRKLR